MKPARSLLLALIPILLLATSCPLLNLWSERPQPVNNITPSAIPCVVTTGERPYPPIITGRPRETARPGESLTITFTSGYMVLPKCKRRDGKEYYQYPTMKELSETMRTTIVQLDGKELTSVRCGHECQISFALP
ncbi:MAG TPA: hypothetical protein VLG46_01300, partial [Anaerolineae bacterium]|nr:hypothetical protein [Anaerolineae bacterium]